MQSLGHAFIRNLRGFLELRIALGIVQMETTTEVPMFKIVFAGVAIALAAVGVPGTAEARNGGAIAAGVIGGLAAGAIIGGASRGYGGGYYDGGYGGSNYYGGPAYGYSSGYYSAPAYTYSSGPAYYGDGSGCYLQRERVWTDYGWRIRRVRVCD